MTELSPVGLKNLQEEALAALAAVDSAAALESWRVAYIGRKGTLTLLLRELKDVPATERKVVGQAANDVRVALQAAFAAAQEKFGEVTASRATKKKSAEGVTYLSGLPEPGHLHPLTLTIRRIQRIFSELGFGVVEGPEVEDQTYNFDLLNIPPTHPTRSETDTFYVEGGPVLRVHTSPVQLRAVLQYQLKPPFKIISPGRVFRSERTDATHETTFYQFEGLALSDKTTVADLKGAITEFYSRFFEAAVTIRLRPSYFPFVEPGFEVDMSCVFCKAEGCRICKYSGWIEIMGAGMVHPTVIANMQFDPAQVQGYAFGGAVDRLAMLYYGIDDIRNLWTGDLKFLKQF